MRIEVRTDGNIQGGEQLLDHIKATVRSALDRFDGRIRRVDVHLSDVIGNKPGHDDKCCMIEAHRDGREPIVVTHRETAMDHAIQDAIHNLEKAVEKALGKESRLDHTRDHN